MKRLFTLSISLCLSILLSAQIKEELTTLKTYPFSDPNPIPILESNAKIYPYHKFEGYAVEGTPKEWKTIHLENDYIELWVLPEVGGKVWGARDKRTGKEFIYRNEVMKFRNIAMRGPWTSGGIEFNFGIIGHTPATATPVDYVIEEEEDGSVSCIVGTMDLPSRTQWRVRIRLPKDKAYFETEALWYNPTPTQQAYYNWMTAAAKAADDLQFYCPGDAYVKHSGEPRPYPMEYGRDISKYSENDFTGSKSYHVVGEYNDFFGGYYQDDDSGFGHWSRYEEMPGQKLWIWALSRQGGIWEDLLTDTDGQYIEFQAGRLFDQYFPGEKNPISQAAFPAHATDQWEERWFPVLDIGGLSEVSPKGILHAERQGEWLHFGIQALEESNGRIKIYSGKEEVYNQNMSLLPLEVAKDSVLVQEDWNIAVSDMDLSLNSDPSDLLIERPFTPSPIQEISTFEEQFRAGVEAKEYRNYAKAEELLNAALSENPTHLEALAHLAELHYWKAEYEKGLELTLSALQIDTYHPFANYIGGILYQAKKDYLNAKEMLGWAARSLEYRSAAYALMAEMELAENNTDEAIYYAQKSLNFNRFNVVALEVMIVANRLNENEEQQRFHIEELLTLDPLSHFGRYENYLLQNIDYQSFIQNEFPEQSYLELALRYSKMNRMDEAVRVLKDTPEHPLLQLWIAYLQQDENALSAIEKTSVEFVFPYRNETLEALAWANSQSDHWAWDYYLGLMLWNKNRAEEALPYWEQISNQPESHVVYSARAAFLEQQNQSPQADLEKAVELGNNRFSTHQRLIQYTQKQNDFPTALAHSKLALSKFPDNYAIAMLHVKNLIHSEDYAAAIDLLNRTNVLPFEGASEGRQLYEQAHYGQAMNLMEQEKYEEATQTLLAAKEWKENLGVGKPYDPDERMVNYLLYQIAKQEKSKLTTLESYQSKVIEYTKNFPQKNSYATALALALMLERERSDFIIRHYPTIEQLPTNLKRAVQKSLNMKRTEESSLTEVLINRALNMR
jgi:tetratricopeptide (TPR) repeat protein